MRYKYLGNSMWRVSWYIPAENKGHFPCISSAVEIISYPENLASPRVVLWAEASQGLRLTSTLYSTECNPKLSGGTEGPSSEFGMDEQIFTDVNWKCKKELHKAASAQSWLWNVSKIYRSGVSACHWVMLHMGTTFQGCSNQVLLVFFLFYQTYLRG